MPLYVYCCENGHKVEELRSVADRDIVKPCPECGKPLKREFTKNFTMEYVTPTGWAKYTHPGLKEPVYRRKHRNWTPPNRK